MTILLHVTLLTAAELDYIPPDDTLRFSAGELRDCFDIQLVDDRILEEDIEIFNVRVMATEGSGNDIIFSRDTLEVRIVDDDGMCEIYS